MIRRNDRDTDTRLRSESLIAKARRRQLELAMRGQVQDSARYADLATKLKQVVERR